MRGGRVGRALSTAVPLLLAVVGAAVTGAWFWVRGSVQELRGSAGLPGLDSAVTVSVDAFAIPHISGAGELDVFRAQGWVHASERLWQMELLRRTGQGRLSEVFGEAALETDRFVRTLDLWGAAERSVQALPSDGRRVLEAYAAGVNARIREWSGALPPEFVLLRFEPEPWEPPASAVIGKLMTLDLSHWEGELSRFRAADLLGPDRMRYLTLPYPEWGPTILGTVPGPVGPGSSLASPRRAAAGAGALTGARRGVDGPEWDPFEVLSAVSLAGSNAWAVAGIRSWVGQPLIANDMHLPLRAPSTWYLNGLHAEASDLHVAGLSIPGVPGVVVGYNREIAWAFTNGMVDDMDFVIEEVDPDGTAYRSGDSWAPFAVRPETIRVRGREAPVVHRVRETARGPVLSDVLPGIDAVLSVMWTGHRPTTELPGLLGMNRATDPRAFDRAVRGLGSPHQNVIYATARGLLGYRLGGSVPRRSGWNGWLPAPARVVGSGWEGFYPPDTLPSLLNPPRGYIASANNLQAPGWFGVIGVAYPLPFRALRIVERLEDETAWTTDLMRQLQLDTRSPFADRVLPRAIRAADRLGEDSVAVRLSGWDRRVDLDSRDATLFYIWLYRLRELIAADEYEGVGRWKTFPDDALLRILEDGGGPWVDDVRTDTTETLPGLEEQAMRDALSVAAGRTWGEVHAEVSVHPLGRSRWLDRLFGFRVGPHPSPGGPHTIRPDDAGRWMSLDFTSWVPPFTNDYGPSQRFVAELRPGRSIGYFLLPTGQSGNPFSRHYRDMAERWYRSDLIPVPVYRDEVRDRTVRTLQLTPS